MLTEFMTNNCAVKDAFLLTLQRFEDKYRHEADIKFGSICTGLGTAEMVMEAMNDLARQHGYIGQAHGVEHVSLILSLAGEVYVHVRDL